MEHMHVFDARPINKITTLTTLRKKGYYHEYKVGKNMLAVSKKTQVISLDYIYYACGKQERREVRNNVADATIKQCLHFIR